MNTRFPISRDKTSKRQYNREVPRTKVLMNVSPLMLDFIERPVTNSALELNYETSKLLNVRVSKYARSCDVVQSPKKTPFSIGACKTTHLSRRHNISAPLYSDSWVQQPNAMRRDTYLMALWASKVPS